MLSLYALYEGDFNKMYGKQSTRPLFYLGAATFGFFGGFIKEVTNQKKTMDVVQGVGALGIATKAVQQTTHACTYLGHEDSLLWNTMAQVSRGRGVFAATAVATVAGSLAGEHIGRVVTSR